MSKKKNNYRKIYLTVRENVKNLNKSAQGKKKKKILDKENKQY